ncbi:hypothetical protein NUM3379_08640 [Kineococcus sp. NUM-3379]
MRITHLVVSPLFHGTERYVVEVANGQAALGHDVTVVGGAPEVVASLLDPAVRRVEGTHGRQALPALVRLGRQDVVHAHLLRSERVAALAAPANRARRFATQHLDHIPARTAAQRAQERLLSRSTHRFVAVSSAIAAGMPRPATVLRNGVRSLPARTAPRPPGPPTVLLAQRLHHAKDTATALHAWARCGLGEQGWRLRVAGDGPQAQLVAGLVADLGIAGSVELLGWRADVHDLMDAADVFLASARVEPLGLSVLEAMARALPVVASTAPGHLETVGLLPDAPLFAAGDAGACAAALRRVCADAGLRARLGERLRRLQRERFDHDDHVRALLALYGEELGRAHGRPARTVLDLRDRARHGVGGELSPERR